MTKTKPANISKLSPSKLAYKPCTVSAPRRFTKSALSLRGCTLPLPPPLLPRIGVGERRIQIKTSLLQDKSLACSVIESFLEDVPKVPPAASTPTN